jgi:putative ABC transport system ATP-binding protein
MIRTVNLSKIFRTEMVETTALHNVSLEVNDGEFVAVMGPSGCGKSTLLNILGLLDSSDSGEYFFDGTEVSRYSEKQRTNLRKGNIGFIFQSFNLIDDLNIYENVELPLLALGEPQSIRRIKVEEILEKMRIGHRKNHFPRQLSGGQQQRAAISRALITRPKLILADEPTGNLDSINGEQVMELLEEMNATGTTIIMVTHSLNHAERAHRIVNLFDGHLVMERSDKVFEPVI